MSSPVSTPPAMALSIRRILTAYRAAFVACIVALSVVTIVRSAGVHAHPEHVHALIIGVVEITAALLFLFRRTQVAGVTGLLCVFTLAAVISIASGQAPFHLVLYAASAVAIVSMDGVLTRDASAR